MPSPRLLAKLVSASGGLSAAALARVREGDRSRGLEAVKPLMSLVVGSICVHSSPPEETRKSVDAYLQALAERYGTIRRVLDALGSSRRKHPAISSDKAHAWFQVMNVGGGMVEQTLKRHASLMAQIANWLSTHPEFENKLDEYERWLDAPLEGEAGHGTVGGGIGSKGISPLEGAKPGSALTEGKKVVAPLSSPASPIRLEDADAGGDEMVSHSDVDAIATLEDSSEQARIAGEGSRDLKFIRLSVLHDKHPGDDPTDRVLTDEQRAAIERLRKEPDQYARAVGLVAAREFLQADNLLPYLDARADPVLLLTLRGDRLYFEGRADEALPVYRQARAKQDDVVTRLNVAVTLLRSTRGSLENNFQEAIDILTEAAFSLGEGTREWARVRSILGLAWSHTPTGDRDKNMRQAISCFDSAATALKRDTDPQWWAETQLHLGRTWLDLPSGDRATNVANAVRHFEHAAQVWTHAKYPIQWATVANCMGTASERNPRGDRQHNLNEALKCYTAALEVCSGQKHSTLWAVLQNNIANVLMQSAAGDHKANVERAIECYSRALEVYTHQNRRPEWAATQNNLGNAFAHLPAEGEDRQKNLRRAIASYRAALEVRTKPSVPHDWATTQNNLGVALSLLSPGANDAPLREAIDCFQHALEVRTRDQCPAEWATTQMNLGRVHGRLLNGERIENLQESAAYYENALEVFTADAHPHQRQLVGTRLKDIRQQILDLGGDKGGGAGETRR